MIDEKALRVRAREAVKAGKLPKVRPERIWGGPGIGARCAVCDEPIERTESEFELQFAESSGCEPAPPGDERPVGVSADGSYHLHVRCFAAWEFERKSGHELQRRGLDGIIRPDERDAARETSDR